MNEIDHHHIVAFVVVAIINLHFFYDETLLYIKVCDEILKVTIRQRALHAFVR